MYKKGIQRETCLIGVGVCSGDGFEVVRDDSILIRGQASNHLSRLLVFMSIHPQNKWSFDHLRLTYLGTVDELKSARKVILI